LSFHAAARRRRLSSRLSFSTPCLRRTDYAACSTPFSPPCRHFAVIFAILPRFFAALEAAIISRFFTSHCRASAAAAAPRRAHAIFSRRLSLDSDCCCQMLKASCLAFFIIFQLLPLFFMMIDEILIITPCAFALSLDFRLFIFSHIAPFSLQTS
jgi:hypothetical protein